MANVTIDIATEFKGRAAFKQAETSVSSLDKAVNKLGKQFLGLFAVDKIIAFGKASVKAFAEDQKSAALLANTVKNLGLAFEQPAIDDYIAKLEKSAGIVDEQLRPAFQNLLTTTGSVTKSQELLTQAIDVSRGSGVDLATVIQDLDNAYVGNTKGLKKYNLGLTAAELKASSFTDIQKKLTAQFSGASAAYLDTYAGKMDILATAADNAKETIGKGLIDSLTLLSGNTSVSDIATQMQDFATYTSDALVGISDLAKGLSSIKLPSWFDKVAGVITGGLSKPILDYFANRGAKLRTPATGASTIEDYNMVADGKAQAAALKAAEAKAAKRAKELAAAQAKQTKALKDQSALKKQSALFDLQQIELVAALKGKLSDEDKKRAELQLAILQGDEDTAAKLTAQIADAIDKTGKLKTYLLDASNVTDPFKSWLDSLQKVAAQLATISAFNAQVSGNGSSARGTGFADLSNTTQGLVTGALQGQAGVTKGGDVYVTVQGSVVSQTELLDAVQNGLQLQSLSGSPSVIGRIAGMFG